MNSYVPEETTNTVVEEIKEEPIQAEAVVEEQNSTPPSATAEPESSPAQLT